MFSWQLSGEFIVFIIIGGVGRLFGPVIGALIFVWLEHLIGGISDYWHIFLGVHPPSNCAVWKGWDYWPSMPRGCAA